MVTLGELLELPVLHGARLEGGSGSAACEIGWLTTVRIRPARPQELRPGELLLLPPESGAASAPGGLLAVVRQLLRHEPAAVAIWEPIPPEVRAALTASGRPWLAVPASANAGAIERAVTRYIADQQAELQRVETTAYRELLELVIHGRGIGALLAALARLTDKVVALEDPQQRLVRMARPPGQGLAPATSPAADLADGDRLNGANAAAVRAWLSGLAVSATDPPTALFDLDRHGWARLVAPVHATSGPAGLLSLLAPRDRFTGRDRLLLKRATTACALELAKQSAVADAHEQPRAEFVDSLLAGDLPEPALVEHRAARLGLRLGASHNVLALRPAGDAAAASGTTSLDRRLEELLTWHLGADAGGLAYRAANGVLALVLPLERFADAAALATWAADLHRRLAQAWSAAPLSAGLGRPRPGLEGIHLAYQDALWALDLGERLFGPGRLTPLQDLGVYQLLLALEHQPVLHEFYRTTLGPLVEYDEQKRTDLVDTLEAYIEAGSSPSETAHRLHLHRNTVLYRLWRIRELLGRDPDEPEERLQLHLALRARVVLGHGTVRAAPDRTPRPARTAL